MACAIYAISGLFVRSSDLAFDAILSAPLLNNVQASSLAHHSLFAPTEKIPEILEIQKIQGKLSLSPEMNILALC